VLCTSFQTYINYTKLESAYAEERWKGNLSIALVQFDTFVCCEGKNCSPSFISHVKMAASGSIHQRSLIDLLFLAVSEFIHS
jgi:hypothetical protein